MGIRSNDLDTGRRRRRGTAAGLCAVGAVLLSACGSAASGGSGGGSGAASGGAAQAVIKPLRVLLPNEPSSLDPVVTPTSSARVYGAFLDPMIATDTSFKLTADGLITKWTQTTPTTWQFTLRANVKFQNGEPWDATAAGFNITTIRDTAKANLHPYLVTVTATKAVDPLTLEVTTATADSALPAVLASVYVVPPSYYQTKGSAGFAAAPVGTGAFKFVSHAAAQNVKVVADPSSWHGAPKISEITFTFAADPAQRVALTQTGAVDLNLDVPFDQTSSLAGTSSLKITSLNSLLQPILFLMGTKAPFDNPKLRAAAAMAVDRDTIIKTIFQSTGAKSAPHLLDIGALGATDSDTVAYAPDQAKQLVSEVGGSPEVTLTFATDNGTKLPDVAEAVAGMWEAVGFKVKRNPLPYATLVKNTRASQLTGGFMFPASPVFPDPSVYATGFLVAKSLTQNCPDSTFDGLATQALAATSPADAQSLYSRMDKQAIVDDHCYVPMYKQVTFYAMPATLQGLAATPLSVVDYSKLYFSS